MISLSMASLGWSMLKSKTFWKALIIGAILWAIWLGWGFYNDAIAENARLEENLATVSADFLAQIEESDRQRREADRLQVILAERERARAELSVSLETTMAKLKELEEQNEEARDWLRTRINPDVVNLLRAESQGGEGGTELPDATGDVDAGVPLADPDG